MARTSTQTHGRAPTAMGYLLIISSVVAMLASSDVHAQVHCSRFTVVLETQEDGLLLSVDTDLPDDTRIIVTVRRDYWQKADPEDYTHDYFSDLEGPLANWREPQRISVGNEEWERGLEKHIKSLRSMGLTHGVERISDEITVEVTVPSIDQTNPAFGSQNSGLTGSMVRSGMWGPDTKEIEWETSMKWPIGGGPVSLKAGKPRPLSHLAIPQDENAAGYLTDDILIFVQRLELTRPEIYAACRERIGEFYDFMLLGIDTAESKEPFEWGTGTDWIRVRLVDDLLVDSIDVLTEEGFKRWGEPGAGEFVHVVPVGHRYTYVIVFDKRFLWEEVKSFSYCEGAPGSESCHPMITYEVEILD